MKASPLYESWKKIKEDYADVILLMRIGEFYEAFGRDAVTMARECEIVVTSRSFGAAGHIEMCGVPFQAVDRYVARLIAKGHRVAICDRMGEVEVNEGEVAAEEATAFPSYYDADGTEYFTGQGLGSGRAGEPWFTLKRRQGKGSHRVVSKNLPMRERRKDAQEDLAAYAQRRGYNLAGEDRGDTAKPKPRAPEEAQLDLLSMREPAAGGGPRRNGAAYIPTQRTFLEM